ncbi:uncharacterized protein TNCV_2207011 [Trichonephila clavipes]|uniref:Uncharacterized protein n=1 Tax=Trichonephila clavipes TaxID=2585209 RepID=A0A8X6VGK2_TRICX|nr:uncharacterized protein TNCV_2207011 [Trichonephila clavipes]
MDPCYFRCSCPRLLPFHLAAVAEWYRYRTVACFVMGSNPAPLKTRRVGQRCTLNLSRAETSSRWCGVVVRRGGCQLSSPVIKVSDHGSHVMSSSPVPLNTHRLGKRCTLHLPRAQTSSRWCGVVVRRRRCQLRCRPRHLTLAQNEEVRHQKPSCS